MVRALLQSAGCFQSIVDREGLALIAPDNPSNVAEVILDRPARFLGQQSSRHENDTKKWCELIEIAG
jgi:hypothetical protein